MGNLFWNNNFYIRITNYIKEGVSMTGIDLYNTLSTYFFTDYYLLNCFFIFIALILIINIILSPFIILIKVLR